MKGLASAMSRAAEAAKNNPELVKVLVDVLRSVLGSSDPVEAGKRAALAAAAKQAYRR
jgi:hypothetical protein